jgi:hypothetical protein
MDFGGIPSGCCVFTDASFVLQAIKKTVTAISNMEFFILIIYGIFIVS